MKNIFSLIVLSISCFACIEYSEIELNDIPASKQVSYFLIGSDTNPYFYHTKTYNITDSFPISFLTPSGYFLKLNSKVLPFNLEKKDPGFRLYQTTTAFSPIQANERVEVLAESKPIGNCQMPIKPSFSYTKNVKIIKGNLDVTIMVNFSLSVLNYQEINQGISIALDNKSIYLEPDRIFATETFSPTNSNLDTSYSVNKDFESIVGTPLNMVLSAESLKRNKGIFSFKVEYRSLIKDLHNPIKIPMHISNVDENIVRYAKNSRLNGSSAQSSVIPFTFIDFNNLKDRYGFIGCYNVATDTIRIPF
jgi:hypothetical protein